MTKISPEKQHELALHVLKRLRETGHQALWAGGCVRDRLLGRTPNDYDIATDATPAAIREIFGRRRTLEIGAAFGVVAVLGTKGAGSVEVSTFRRDVQYSDGRHPDAVVFSTPEEDAQRRDFTINGLFYDPLNERVIDYVGGQDDLERGILRAIGDPRARFAEDKLRMLRAVRIASVFQFALDPATQAAIEEMAETIIIVSPERIAQELRKILVDGHRAQAVELLRTTRLLSVILPELDAVHNHALHSQRHSSASHIAWSATLRVLAELQAPSFPLALAALLHGIGADSAGQVGNDGSRSVPAVASEVCKRLKLANKELHVTTWVLANYRRLASTASQRWSSIQPLLVAPAAEELVQLYEACGRVFGGSAAEQSSADVAFCRQRLALPAAELNPPPLLSGDNLVRLGVPKGAIYRRILDRVRAAQLDDEVKSRDDALTLARKLIDELGPPFGHK